MAEQHSSRKLTRADVLVAAITCLLLILVVPMLFARPREGSVRRLCAANLAQIGKAMLLYAGDNEGALPRAGGPGTVWGATLNWLAIDRRAAFGIVADDTHGQASINASFYLLVKYCGMPPKVFVCKGDHGTTEWKLSEVTGIPRNYELADAWDFGPPSESFKHCSYAYHVPYGIYPLDISLDPNLAVAADRSPWIESPASYPSNFADFKPDVSYMGGAIGGSEQARAGNSVTHQRDGQNVLFLDGRVTFEKRAYCGVGRDNIYTISRDVEGRGDSYGMASGVVGPSCVPANRNDSVIVHDPPGTPDTRKR